MIYERNSWELLEKYQENYRWMIQSRRTRTYSSHLEAKQEIMETFLIFFLLEGEVVCPNLNLFSIHENVFYFLSEWFSIIQMIESS